MNNLKKTREVVSESQNEVKALLKEELRRFCELPNSKEYLNELNIADRRIGYLTEALELLGQTLGCLENTIKVK